MDLQLMDYRNSSKCASALCFVFVMLFLQHVLAAFMCHVWGEDWFKGLRTHRNVLFMYIIYGLELFTSSLLQVYGQSPTNDDINQNSSLHPSIKAPSNVLASTFFGKLWQSDRDDKHQHHVERKSLNIPHWWPGITEVSTISTPMACNGPDSDQPTDWCVQGSRINLFIHKTTEITSAS